MVAQTIVVAGFGRCGSSLMMQMLQAAGVPCVGTFPDFEVPEVAHLVTPEFIAACAGKAVKVLDPQRVGLPGDVRVIWMDRDVREQAKSHAKFVSLTVARHYSRDQRRALERQLVADRARVMRQLAGRPLLAVQFERLLEQPGPLLLDIERFLDRDLNTDNAARRVIRRPPACMPDLRIEQILVTLVENARKLFPASAA